MKISLSWLNDYISIEKYKPEDLATIFTSLGIEVETIEHVSTIQGPVVVGKIISAEKHPDADKLQICEVDVGEAENLTIVCGGANARPGIKVCCARIGAVLGEDFKIKSSKVRGQKSDGMLCGGEEIGIEESSDGILELSDDCDLGHAIADIYKLNDVVFELGLTPNRGDCNGYLGLARDLSAKLGLPLKTPKLESEFVDESFKSESEISVSISAPDSCARFSALAVKNVEAAPSPYWVKQRLENSGMRSKNVLVDVTNYVMLEYGQPIHAYDSRDLAGQKIDVRMAQSSEKMTTLDGEEHALTADDILICDGERPVGLAGVMGGQNSEVKDDTTHIVIEVASFDPVRIRKTSKRLGLHTEASHRFERGTDIQCTSDVARRVAKLVGDWTKEVKADDALNIKVASTVVDNYPKEFIQGKIALRIERLQQISGNHSLEQKTAQSILEGLGFPLLDQKDGRMLFGVPSWRHDITKEIDLIEEVVRVHGFEKMTFSLPVMDIRPIPESKFIEFGEQVKVAMALCGFSETISFPFISREDLEKFRLAKDHPMQSCVELENALVSNENLMQPSLLFGLLRAVDGNVRQGQNGIKLFESARAYFHSSAKDGDLSSYFASLPNKKGHLTDRAMQDDRPIERNVVSAIISQPYHEKNWLGKEEAATYFHGKALTEKFLAAIGIHDYQFTQDGVDQLPFLHPGASAVIVNGDKQIGYVGELHPQTSSSYGFDVENPPVCIEILLEEAFAVKQQGYAIDTVSHKFPPSTRDLAFIVPKHVTNADVENSMLQFRKRNLSRFQIFDVYEGDRIGQDEKSLAYKFYFQSAKRTLSDKDVDKEVELILKHLKENVGASLR